MGWKKSETVKNSELKKVTSRSRIEETGQVGRRRREWRFEKVGRAGRSRKKWRIEEFQGAGKKSEEMEKVRVMSRRGDKRRR